MRTIFEGTVNGKVFNNVKEYNEALVAAINAGECVSADSRTYTVKDEDENPPMKSKTNFFGSVNGVEYNNVEDYNKAVQEVLTSGKPLNAQSSTRTECENECGCNCCSEPECENDEDFFFPGLNETEEDVPYYLDTITGNPNHDEELLEAWEEDLADNFEAVLKEIKSFTSKDLQDYLEDLQDALVRIGKDKTNIKDLQAKYTAEIDIVQEQIEKLQLEMNNLIIQKEKSEENLRVIDGCEKLNDIFTQHYIAKHDAVESQLMDLNKENNCENCNGVEPKELTDDNIRNAGGEVIRKLIKNLFPTI